MEFRIWKCPVAPSNARCIWQPWAIQIPTGWWIMDIGMQWIAYEQCVVLSSLLAGRAWLDVYARWMDQWMDQ